MTSTEMTELLKKVEEYFESDVNGCLDSEDFIFGGGYDDYHDSSRRYDASRDSLKRDDD